MGSGDVATRDVDGAEVRSPAPRYVLITECLQNDFFRNRQSRLCLPAHVVRPMLYSKQAIEDDATSSKGGDADAETVGAVDDKRLRDGPLEVFFEAAMGARRRARRDDRLEHLHVINVRDWHAASAEYDVERRIYGSHCERGSTGAEYIAGFEHWLDPAGAQHRYPGGEPRDHHDHKLSVYHVHSNSLFDFKPRVSRSEGQARMLPSELQMLLDVLIRGTDDDVQQLKQVAAETLDDRLDELTKLADGLTGDFVERAVYIAVIGVYTDIKIEIVLGGIRTRYNVLNLAVSDTFTASPSLERHLAGLDFASKVLNVEVVHGVDSLVRFLGGTVASSSENVVSSAPFAIYQNYLRDKQEVLAYQTEKVREYAFMTERRSAAVYATVKRANQFLLMWGSAFLVLTIALVIVDAIDPGRVDWKVPLVTGGIGIAQLVSLFFKGPMENLQANLTNLAILRMILESHSLKTAFTRFFLTNPQALREIDTEWVEERAKRQIEVLQAGLDAIERIDNVDFKALRALGYDIEETDGEGADGAPAPDPSAADGAAGSTLRRPGRPAPEGEVGHAAGTTK
jgi:hypothetical protein